MFDHILLFVEVVKTKNLFVKLGIQISGMLSYQGRLVALVLVDPVKQHPFAGAINSPGGVELSYRRIERENSRDFIVC